MCMIEIHKPTQLCRGNASVVFTRLTRVDNNCVVKASREDTYGWEKRHIGIEGSHV